MSKQFWAVIVVIIVVLGGVFLVTNNKKSTGGNTSASTSNHVEGSTASGVTLVEYGDYQCPACEAYSSVVLQVTGKYLSQIQFQFRNFPLTSLHPNAFAGARAAEAAALQGKFWQMHDALYASQNYLQWAYANGGVTSNDPTPYFQQYAKSLGLDITKFNTDFASSAVNSTINADIKAGNALNISGTPTFFLDGKQVANAPQTLTDWSTLIDAAIASKKVK